MDQTIFGTVPPRKLFAKLAVPSLISMFFSSIYMMVDGMFVGSFIGSTALAAVNLVFPFLIILFSLGDMISTGASVKIGIKLGEKDIKGACNTFTVAVITFTVLNILLMMAGLIFAKPVIFSVIKDSELALLAYRFAIVFISMFPVVAPFFAFDNYVRLCGKARYSMWVNICVSVFNIILDAVLIGEFGLGIEYAALGSALSMSLGTVALLFPFVKKKLSLSFVKPHVDFKEMRQIVYNGSSGFLSMTSGSIIAVIVNGLLLHLGGSDGVAAYSIVMYIESAVVPLLFALTDSISPVISYNYGAKNIKRVMKFFRLTCVSGAAISAVTLIVIYAFPDFMVNMFAKEDSTVAELARTALLLNSAAYIFTWFNMTVGAFLTGFEKATASIIISMLSSVVLPLILLFTLSNTIGINGIFVTPAISSLITAVVAFIIWKRTSVSVHR